MAKGYTGKIVTAIDVGTTKICVLIGQQLEGKKLDVLGVGKSVSDGLRKGVVVDIARTVRSIKVAVKEAELMAGMSIESAVIGISGGHISSLSSNGVVPIKTGQVTQHDIDNALSLAKAVPIAEGRQILHVLPQYFVIDGQDKIHDPVGMHGLRLEVVAHLILGATVSVQNLVTCCQMAGVQVNDIVLEQLASAYAVLSTGERTLGVAVLDIGGGTSDLAIYQDESIRHTKVFPIAGNHFTHDLAVGLRAPLEEAERVKKEFGIVHEELLLEDQVIEVKLVYGGDTKLFLRSEVIPFIKPRAEELLLFVYREIIAHHLRSYVTTGLVLTGGGALLVGIKELAEKIFKMPVRIGYPYVEFDLPESLRNPMYATSYGILLYALDKSQLKKASARQGPLINRVFEHMKSWVSDFF